MSPLTRIAQLCCSIDPSVQCPATNTIRSLDRAGHLPSFSRQPTDTDLLAFRSEINFRYGNHARSSSLRRQNLQRGRRRSAPVTRKSINTAKRYMPSPSSAVEFYFRSLAAARPFAASFDFRYPETSVSWPRVVPTLSSIARPRALRAVPRFSAFLPTGNGIFDMPPIDQQVRSPVVAECGHFRSPPMFPSGARNAVPLNCGSFSSGNDYIALSRDLVANGPEVVTSPEVSGNICDHQRSLASHWNSPSSLCLPPLSWQSSY